MEKYPRNAISMFTGVRAVILFSLILGGAAYVWGALKLGLVYYGTPGAGLFPLLSGVLVVAMAVISLFEISSDKAAASDPIENWSRLAIYSVGTLFWALTFSYLGFTISSAIAIFVATLFAERQGVITSGVITAVSIAVSWAFFYKMLSVPLPSGILFR